MKIKEMLLSGFVFTTFNWGPPKIDYENVKNKLDKEALFAVMINEYGVACIPPMNVVATANQIRAWNQYLVDFYQLKGFSAEEVKERFGVIVENIDGKEIFI